MAIDGLLIIILLVILSFVAAFLDAAIGIGYGTLLTPLLILLNLPVLEIVPAVLFAQIVAAATIALFYAIFGNIKFTRSSDDTHNALLLSLAGIIGATIAIALFFTLFTINPAFLQIYIAIALLLIGILVLTKFHWRLTTPRIFTIGAIAAINKGLSGGGYTPIVAGGLLLGGRTNKQAIGITNVAKTASSLTALFLYFLLSHLIFNPTFITLIIPLTLGTLIATPLASYLIKRSKSHHITPLIGVTIIFLGIFTLLKTLLIPIP